MFEEEHPLPGFRTPTEAFVFWQLAVMLCAGGWFVSGATIWSASFLLAMSWLTPFFIGMHLHGGLGRDSYSFSQFLLGNLPFLLSVIILIVGLFFPSLKTFSLGSQDYFMLEAPKSIWLPTVTSGSPVFSVFLTGSLYMAALGILFIADSHYMLRTLLMVGGINAAIIAIFGIVGTFFGWQKILFIITPSSDFFSTFPILEHWGAYALLWVLVLCGISDQWIRRDGFGVYLSHGGIWIALSILLLATTVVFFGTLPQKILLSIALGIIAFYNAEPPARRSSQHPLLRRWGLRLVALPLIGWGLFWPASLVMNKLESPASRGNTPSAVSEQQALIRDSLEMIEDRPIFGWGAGSYPVIASFYQEVDLGDRYYGSPRSSLLQMLVEKGIVGCLLWWTVPCVLLVRFFRLRFRRDLSFYLWSAVLTAVILGIIEFPFHNPLFLLSFWIILMTAYRWSKVAVTPSGFSAASNLVFSKSEALQRKPSAQP